MAKRRKGRKAANGEASTPGPAERRKSGMQTKVVKAFDLLADPSLSVKQVAKRVALPLDTVNSLAYRGAYKEYRPRDWSLPERRPLVRRVKIGRKLYQSIAAAAGRVAGVVEIGRWRNLLMSQHTAGGWRRRRRSRHDEGYRERGVGSIAGFGLV